MNYELAKELKDAGFPDLWTGEPGSGFNLNEDGTEYAYAPTLSELIEACGSRFDCLERDRKNRWGAWDGGKHRPTGSTPEEAVARLWLALNASAS